jgi:Lar family restriction alleviation protein
MMSNEECVAMPVGLSIPVEKRPIFRLQGNSDAVEQILFNLLKYEPELFHGRVKTYVVHEGYEYISVKALVAALGLKSDEGILNFFKPIKTKLNDCPFCGGKAELKSDVCMMSGGYKYYWVECQRCGCKTREVNKDEGAAVSKWNNRNLGGGGRYERGA